MDLVLPFHLFHSILSHVFPNLGARAKSGISFASLTPATGSRHCWSSNGLTLTTKQTLVGSGLTSPQGFSTALSALSSSRGSLIALRSTTPFRAAMGDSKSFLFLIQQMSFCLQKGNECLCMAQSLTGMSGEVLMLLPHKQLSFSSSSMASCVTSCFSVYPAFHTPPAWSLLLEGFLLLSPHSCTSWPYQCARATVHT